MVGELTFISKIKDNQQETKNDTSETIRVAPF